MLLQASLLIVVLFLLDLAFQRYARAVVRYGLWLLVLVKLVLPPSLALPTSIGYWLDTGKQPPVKQTLPATTVLRFSEASGAESEPKFSPPPAAPALGFAAFGLLIWIAASVILLGILIRRSRNVARRVAEAAEAPEQLQELLNSCCRQMRMRQTTTLKLAGFAMSPAACGLLRPVILIPEELVNQLSMPSLRAVLLHELGHIKRGDLWVNYLQTLLQIVYWYHPLLWLANAQIRRSMKW
jgi:beta-lactamase regulating signal transducer with metallopeptidase domain